MKRTFLLRYASVAVLSVGVLSVRAQQPLVAVHDSELTRALEARAAVPPTPTGTGTTGFEWWPTDWHYFVMPESVKEALRSDGTAFTVVGDSNIVAGALLDGGAPKYPIMVSFASEAIRNDEIAPLTNYVAAGGFLVVGSSAFTRNTNGTTRGDFAFANELGVHLSVAGLNNWAANNTFVKQLNHRLVSHIPSGQLTWRMPSFAEEIPWGVSPSHPFLAPHDVWKVQVADATVLAGGDSSPFLTIKPYGKGYFIYWSAFQPLIGHSGFAPSMYAYVILRRAIEWAFESANLPVPKLSPWPYQYDAAFMIRHDLENFTNEISHIEASAQVEAANGARGDYYFCTGTLRDDASPGYNTNAIVASLRRAVTNYGATIGSHNGGLKNPSNPSLVRGQYDYWHWGTDEALDVTPAGYSSGKAYALASLNASFNDIERWLKGITNGLRSWVGCYFNATREDSYDVQAQAGVKIAGEQKLTPFPHWTISTKTAGKRYNFVSQPVSDWFVGGLVAQSLEPWHPPGVHTSQTVHNAVDFYYGLGGLINLYSHTLSTGEGDAGQLVPDYITYSLNTNLHPRIWSANAAGVYQWWVARSNAQITVSYTTNGSQSIATFSIKGARDANTSVEMLAPTPFVGLQVLTNGVVASGTAYRTSGKLIRVRVGSTVTNAVIRYGPSPTANDDFFIATSSLLVTIPAPGVLANDTPVNPNGTLTASTITGPSHGVLVLGSDGGFTLAPTAGFVGVDSFTYRANEGSLSSGPAVATVMLTPSGYLFYDDFGRPATSTTIAPWVKQAGTWNITNGALQGSGSANGYVNAYYNATGWTDYTVQGKVQFSSANGFGGGIGGRLNPVTGAHYAAWVYPDGSAGGSRVLKLIKFEGWTTWSFTPMAIASLPAVGTSAHTLSLTFLGAQISVSFDGVQRINVTDNNFDGVAPYTAGGITTDIYTDSTAYNLSFDDVTVTGATANGPVITTQPVSRTNAAGTTATFTVAATGTGLSYQWLKNGSTISGATTTILTLPSVTSADAAGYSVRVSNSVASVTSSTATLTVIDPPVIVTQPASRTNLAGTTASFTVAASGSPAVYRWVKNGTTTLVDGGNISGATSATLSLANLSTNDAGTYTVVLTNLAGSVASAPATLTVIGNTANGPVITTQPVSRTNAAGTTATFTVAATGTSLSYQWLKNGNAISGATTTILALASVTSADAAGYAVVVSNSVAVVTSSTATLTVIEPPVIVTQPASRTNFTGTTVSFTVVASGSPAVYRWLKNGTTLVNGGNVSGATSATLSLANLTTNDAGNYSVILTNLAGSATSGTATLTVVVTNSTPPSLFSDDFTRSSDPGPLAPWLVQSGTWTVSGGTLRGTRTSAQTYGFAYITNSWGDYTAQGQVQFPAGAYGGGIGGRLNRSTGAHYGAWIYPEGSSGGSSVMKLVKFQTWTTWGYNGNAYSPMMQVSLPGVGTNWHTVQIRFVGNQITVSYDGSQVINMADAEASPYLTGGISADMWSDATAYTMQVDNVLVTSGSAGLTSLARAGDGPIDSPTLADVQSISVADGKAVITWITTPGVRYRLQAKASLSDESWNDVTEDIISEAPTMIFSEEVGNAPSRFYRVLVLP